MCVLGQSSPSCQGLPHQSVPAGLRNHLGTVTGLSSNKKNKIKKLSGAEKQRREPLQGPRRLVELRVPQHLPWPCLSCCPRLLSALSHPSRASPRWQSGCRIAL